jgi:dehydrogenase/reductase SDR family protein 12
MPAERLVSGAFYLDRKPQMKHITGTFNSDGGFTRNTRDQVLLMMKRLEEYT